jgi:D-3-phosphoglycerate dehydrogenase
MINNSFIKTLEKQPIIINTSRGEIVREKDIIIGLKDGKLKGYGADVIEDEFGEIDNSPIIRGIKSGYNILVTPHVGGMTWQGQYRAWKWAIDKFKYNA